MNGSIDSFLTVGKALASALITANPNSGLSQQIDAEYGKLRWIDGKAYRLVKANAAIAAAANKVVVKTAGTANTWTVNTTTSSAAQLVAGVIPAGQVGSDGSTGLVSGDYFLVQVAGEATPIITTNALAAGTGIVTDTTAGQGATVSATYAATTQGAIYAILNVASVTNSPTVARLTIPL
jgi:hypothetical protein